ncbi:MAG: ATP-dependent sacrificial sulfur transferase LarE [Planctomycetes bacterium]|nr:ATP-dependent sacrificial sulfur transferase LarE [Planctomycetota bacterium]
MTKQAINAADTNELSIRAAVDSLLAEIRRPLVALSGGVDSALLAARAALVGGGAATLVSSLFPEEEMERARATAKQLGIRHYEVAIDPLSFELVRSNPVDRCYHCRRAGMGLLVELAEREGYGLVVDGENADDSDDYRPGTRAMRELGMRGLFREAGMTKAMIRRWAAELGLSTASTPAAACLATRIPFGTELSLDKLRRIENSENFIKNFAIRQVRGRDLAGLACIEVDKDSVAIVAAHGEEISARLKELGFDRVALDLAGYSMGSLNPASVKNAR